MTATGTGLSGRARRIVFYNDGAGMGGLEIMLIEVLRALAADGASLTLVHSAANPALRDRVAALLPSVRLVEVPTASRRLDNISPLFRPLAVLRTHRLLASLAPDLIVLAQGRIELCVVGLLAARLSGRPVASYIPLAHPLGHYSKHWSSPLREAINSLLYRLPHRYVAMTPGVAADLRKRCRCPVEVLPSCIDPARLALPSHADARARLGVPADAYLLGVISRLQSDKGQETAIRALAALRDEPDLHLLLAGSGPDRERLEALASSLGIAPRVLFRPWSADLATIYGAIDLLVIPIGFESHSDDIPLVMMEAMALGIPVVATAVCGIPAYLPQDWLAPVNDAAALAAAIGRHRSRCYAAEISALRARAESEFSLALFRQRALRFFLDDAPGATRTMPSRPLTNRRPLADSATGLERDGSWTP